MAEDRTSPSRETREEERKEAHASSGAPQRPTREEAEAADRNVVAEGVEEAYEDMARRGADAEGEGRIP